MIRSEHSLPFQPKYDSAMVNSGYGNLPNHFEYVSMARPEMPTMTLA